MELDQQYARIISLEQDKKEKDIVWMGTNYGHYKIQLGAKKNCKAYK